MTLCKKTQVRFQARPVHRLNGETWSGREFANRKKGMKVAGYEVAARTTARPGSPKIVPVFWSAIDTAWDRKSRTIRSPFFVFVVLAYVAPLVYAWVCEFLSRSHARLPIKRIAARWKIVSFLWCMLGLSLHELGHCSVRVYARFSRTKLSFSFCQTFRTLAGLCSGGNKSYGERSLLSFSSW